MAFREPAINFIPGSNVTIATVDNTTLQAVDVTIAASSGATATDANCWMPLTTVTALTSAWFPLFDSSGDLVLDTDGNLIPTLLTFTGVSHDELVFDADDSLIPTFVPTA